MQIAQIMAGYSLAGADLLRRAMGKKIKSEMEAQRKTFIDGAVAKGHSTEKAIEIFDLMAKFADYGFNKSHAAAYALVSYQTAYLRANHPVEFLAACMSLSISNTDKLAVLRADAVKLGLQVLPPDINHSAADFTPETLPDGTRAIRYALGAIKRAGLKAMEDLVASRQRGHFKDLSDFAGKIDARNITRGQIEILAKAGAFDSLHPNRAQVYGAAETIARTAQATAQERDSGQAGLFGGAEPEKIRLPETPDWPQSDRLIFEAEAIGFHISAHPLDAYSSALKRLNVVTSGAIQRRAEAGATRVKLAGTLGAKKERITKTGSRMMWATLSDREGSFEVTLFSEVLGRAREILTEGTALLVTADLKLEGEQLRITASEVTTLESAAAAAGASLRIWFDSIEAVPPIRNLLEREGKGRGRVSLVPKTGPERELELALPGGFNVSPRLAQALKMVPGVELVEDL